MKSRFKMKIEKRVCVLVVSRNNIHWKVPPFNFFILLSLPSLISLKLRPLKSCKMGLCSSSLELLRSPLSTIDSNLRMNSFQGGNDEGLQRDEELSLGGVVIRSRLKKLKKNINMKMNSLMEKEEKGDRKIINCSELFD
ncbi:uncharacterized protein LOC114409420 [Glycine soja]|uniref:uncharacterized protein LOC114409420 n=1 Tax=Glycine soja TaxID=3848 RepID=UPI00103F94A2|nr:uncharacterized protein LOC114409420 [Glycine soja]